PRHSSPRWIVVQKQWRSTALTRTFFPCCSDSCAFEYFRMTSDPIPHRISPTGRTSPMLQRLAAWSYRRRRRVLVLWIVALVMVSAIGSSVGSTFSQGFSLSGTESQRATELLES